jgi:hypothetical protein
MATSTQPRVRGKVGAKRRSDQLLDVGQKYISGQAAGGDPQNTLTQQIEAVSTTRTSLIALFGKRATYRANLATNSSDIVTAKAKYMAALYGYAGGAATLANGDATVLAGLGVEPAASPTKQEDEVVGAPVLTIAKGANEGDAKLKCARVPYAGSYVFEYKLEPSLPTDPWLGTITTKLASAPLTGLPAAQLIRARARAIGVTAGPWSVEVVGRAR